MITKFKKYGIASMLVLATIISCTTNPITGRKSVNIIPSSQLTASSFQGYKETLAKSKLSNNKYQVDMIKRVGQRIQKSVEKYYADKGLSKHLQGFQWEYNLIEENTVNAWCMPGGKVAFYTGILPICKDEQGIAVVMGHEIAHAVANHSGERATSSVAQQVGMSVASSWVSENPSAFNQILLQAAGVGTQLGILKFSRKHESESDHMGLIFMAMAGYDPAEAPKFWERMQAAGGQAPPEFLSTHPSSSRRVSDLNKWLNEAQPYYNSSAKAPNAKASVNGGASKSTQNNTRPAPPRRGGR
jgi:predicted Zn-dependent protease